MYFWEMLVHFCYLSVHFFEQLTSLALSLRGNKLGAAEAEIFKQAVAARFLRALKF